MTATTKTKTSTDTVDDYPCQLCDRWKIEGCLLRDFPKYRLTCKRSARKLIAARQAQDNARAKVLGIYRNRHGNWCIAHPLTRHTVTSGCKDLEAALMAFSRNEVVATHIRQLEAEARRGVAPKAKASKGRKHTIT